jgi:hypothetical protein
MLSSYPLLVRKNNPMGAPNQFISPQVTVLWQQALLVAIWTGTQLRDGCYRHLRSRSDTYDIYYENPALLPTIQTEAANYPPGEIWTLDEDREDATIEDVCHFIVEYINSDVMVRIYVYTHQMQSVIRP